MFIILYYSDVFKGGDTFCADNKGLKWTVSGTGVGSVI